MASQLEQHEKPAETQARESQGGEHLANEAAASFKPQAKTENQANKVEPEHLSFDKTDIYGADKKPQEPAKQPEQEKADSTYEIVKGDNLTKIAKRQLGEGASAHDVQVYIDDIAKQNHIKDKNLIYAGATIELPALKVVDSEQPKAADVKPQSNEPGATRPEQPQAAGEKPAEKPAESGATQPVTQENQVAGGDKSAPATEIPAATGEKPPEAQEKPVEAGVAQPVVPPEAADKAEPKAGTVTEAGDKPVENGEKSADKSEIDLSKEHDNLVQIAQDKMSPKEYKDFVHNMSKLESRTGKLEELFTKQGMSSEQATLKAQEQIGKTYQEVSALLEAKDNPAVPIDATGRSRLAQEIMSNAADPTTIRQGNHKTCNVTTLETRLYTREPAAAARMVVDMATTGQYVGGDGTKVGLDQQSLKPDQNAELKDSVSNRNYASQLFQITAVNLHYAKSDPSIHYEQHKVDPTLIPPDTGERLVDYSTNPPKDVSHGWFSKNVLGNDDLEFHNPDLDSDDLVQINDAITGKRESGVIFNAIDNCSDQVVKPTSAKDLEEKLLEAKESGKLPVTVVVHTGNEPFLTDSGNGTAGGSGGWHVVSVTDIEPGSPAKIAIDNQWTNTDDHLGNNKLTSRELFGAMKVAGDAETIKDLTNEVSENRKSGKIDDLKELDLLRLQKMTGKISEEQYNQAFLDHLKESQTRWHETLSKGTNDSSLLKNMSDAGSKQTDILAGLPADKRAEAIKIEAEAGYQVTSVIDNHLGYSIAKTRRDFEADRDNATEPMTAEKQQMYRVAMHNMVEMLDTMSPERQELVRKKVQEYSAEDNKARAAKQNKTAVAKAA